jgi:hypothetical protein
VYLTIIAVLDDLLPFAGEQLLQIGVQLFVSHWVLRAPPFWGRQSGGTLPDARILA